MNVVISTKYMEDFYERRYFNKVRGGLSMNVVISTKYMQYFL
ncbi:hypothetical protein AALF85_04905 [Jeotgalicoccus halotolerans]